MIKRRFSSTVTIGTVLLMAASATGLGGCADPDTPASTPTTTSAPEAMLVPEVEDFWYRRSEDAPHVATAVGLADLLTPLPVWIAQDFAIGAAPFEEASDADGATALSNDAYSVTSSGTQGTISGSTVHFAELFDTAVLQATMSLDPSSTGAGLLGFLMAGGDWFEFSVWPKGAMLVRYDAAADQMVRLAEHEFDEASSGAVAVFVAQMNGDTVHLQGTLDGEAVVEATAPAAYHLQGLTLAAVAGDEPTTVAFDDVLVTGLAAGQQKPPASTDAEEYAVFDSDGSLVADLVAVRLTQEAVDTLAAHDPSNLSVTQKAANLVTIGGTDSIVATIAEAPVATWDASDGGTGWLWHQDGVIYIVTSEDRDAGIAFVSALISA